MKELTRTKVNEFNIENSVTLESLDANKENIQYISIEQVFNNKNKIILDDEKLKHFLNGVMLTYKANEGTYRVYNSSHFIGLGIIKNNQLKRDVII